MTTTLNSPVEIGVRVLAVLAKAFPRPLDISSLLLLDHGLIHSSDLGGPQSLHPGLPIKVGELGVKRDRIRQGLHLLAKASLVETVLTIDGLAWRSSEQGAVFVDLLTTRYAQELQQRADWLLGRFAELTTERLRTEMREVCNSWSQEFDADEAAWDWRSR